MSHVSGTQPNESEAQEVTTGSQSNGEGGERANTSQKADGSEGSDDGQAMFGGYLKTQASLEASQAQQRQQQGRVQEQFLHHPFLVWG